MKRGNKILWGVLLVAVGVFFGLRALGILSFQILFDGWWTLFIIVPCFVGLFTERDKWGNGIGLLVGVLLLLCCQDVLTFSVLWKLVLPLLALLSGLRLIFGGIKGENSPPMGATPRSGCAVFSGSELRFDNERFEGAELTAVFGGVECDLRGAIIPEDCTVRATAVFGGVDIFLPDTVNVQLRSSSLFGGVSDKKRPRPAISGAPTLYIQGNSLFGGVDLK